MAVVKVSGAWVRGRNEWAPVPGAGLVVRAPFLNVGLPVDASGDPLGDVFGLILSVPKLELTASIGRKHCASGLNVFVTSRSAEEESSWCSLDSEKRIYKKDQKNHH